MNLHVEVRAVVALLSCFFYQGALAYENSPEWWGQYGEQQDAIYAHMRRYGINRDDMGAMKRLIESAPPYSRPHVNVRAEKVLNPGEHLRLEIDEYVLTFKIPDVSWDGGWIWPYTNTRQPDTAMQRLLARENGRVKIADLGWYVCGSIFPPGLFGRCETAGPTVSYRILKPEEREDFSTPEKLLQLASLVQRNLLPSKEKIEASLRHETVINHAASQVYLAPKTVVINGRIWVLDAMSGDMNRRYSYTTTLFPDRMLGFSFSIPRVDYNADPDPATYSAPVKRALALMEEVISSLRVAKINDDGSPDPFVIERVEPGPLPVREKLPN